MLQILKNIKAFAFDCDGVMTNGCATMTKDGDAMRTFNIKDGFAVQHAVKMGYPFAIISGGNNIGIKHRFEALGVKDIYLAQSHKTEAFNQFCEKYSLTPNEIAYMGDDMPDIPLLSICGLPCCPKDAALDVKLNAEFISNYNGGEGCARELIEMILKTQNKWNSEQLNHF